MNANLRSLGGESAQGLVFSLRDDLTIDDIRMAPVRTGNASRIKFCASTMSRLWRRVRSIWATRASALSHAWRTILHPWRRVNCSCGKHSENTTDEAPPMMFKALTLKPDEEQVVEFALDAYKSF